MRKIILIIGQSASGKTTYIRKNFLYNHSGIEFIDKPFKLTNLVRAKQKYLLLGHHKGEKRCEGSDELSMAILPQLIEFIKENVNNYDVMIFDGDRINNKKFFEFIASLNIPIDLYILKCSLQESIDRRIKTGSKPSETFVKTTITKSENMKKIGEKLRFNIITINTGKKEDNLMSFIGD